jgi:hypothetical protein
MKPQMTGWVGLSARAAITIAVIVLAWWFFGMDFELGTPASFLLLGAVVWLVVVALRQVRTNRNSN